jgi:hypothetical protein
VAYLISIVLGIRACSGILKITPYPQKKLFEMGAMARGRLAQFLVLDRVDMSVESIYQCSQFRKRAESVLCPGTGAQAAIETFRPGYHSITKQAFNRIHRASLL